jgi:hypothetical protein
MRRRILRILLFLLAGAIVNVAVAWGCAAYHQQPGVLAIGTYVANGDEGIWPRYAGASYPDARVYGWSWQAPGFTGFNLAKATGTSSPPFVEVYRCGWPLRCLEGHDLVEGVTLSRVALRRPFDWAWRAGLTDRPYGPVPCSPLWPGFAVNALFYAALLWLCFCGPFALRRQIRRHLRARRGRCIKCGYDVRGELDAGCPECGWNREDER